MKLVGGLFGRNLQRQNDRQQEPQHAAILIVALVVFGIGRRRACGTGASNLMAAGVPVVLAGDYNVVPTPQDIYPARSLDDNALIQPESRQAFSRLLAQGRTDALRRLHPEGPLWTFWDYKRERWPADKGMRLDHLLLSPDMSERLVDGGVDRWMRGEENASDHAPAWVTLNL